MLEKFKEGIHSSLLVITHYAVVFAVDPSVSRNSFVQIGKYQESLVQTAYMSKRGNLQI